MSAMRHLGIRFIRSKSPRGRVVRDGGRVVWRRRMDDDEENILGIQTNLGARVETLDGMNEALNMFRDVYSGRLKLEGEESLETLGSANNLAAAAKVLAHFQEAKALLRKSTPVARRILGENHLLTLMMKKSYGEVLCRKPTAPRRRSSRSRWATARRTARDHPRVGCTLDAATNRQVEQRPGCGGFGKGNFHELFRAIEEYETKAGINKL